jgi:hypothetical protein
MLLLLARHRAKAATGATEVWDTSTETWDSSPVVWDSTTPPPSAPSRMEAPPKLGVRKDEVWT